MDFVSPHAYWLQGSSPHKQQYKALSDDCLVDVVVVGGGITGLTTAWHLKQAGKSVAVVEAGMIGAGTTSGTSGHLDCVPDTSFRQLIKDFGTDTARAVTQSRVEAIDRIEKLVADHDIECDFRRVPAQYFTERASRMRDLHEECEAARELGVDARIIESASLPFATAGGIEYANMARFHVWHYLTSLAEVLQGDNVSIYEHTRAEIPDGGSPSIEANGHQLTADDAIVLATHSAYLGISQLDLRQAPYQSYVLAVRTTEDVPDALYWDDEDPYHYIRRGSTDDPRLLIIGGADHKTGQADEKEQFAKLERYVSSRFAIAGVEHRWSAELFEPSDGLPFIGAVPGMKATYIATGFSGTGLTFGTVAAQLLSRQVTRGSSAAGSLDDAFSPKRLKALAAAKDFVSENLNVAKRFVGDRMQAEPVDSLEQVPRGEGRIVKLNGEPCAVFRDADNRIHRMSPECTHAGCFVQWNQAETTWDCPCHGGRFSATGQRLYGPPASDLKRLETDASESVPEPTQSQPP